MRDTVICNELPMKLQASTRGVVQTTSLGLALEYTMELGMSENGAG